MLLSCAGGVGMVWNLDSGLFIVVAYATFLAARMTQAWAQELGGKRIPAQARSSSAYARALCLHLVCTALVVLVFFALLALQAGAPLNLSWLFAPQKLFFGLGLTMLPMPRLVHPWMALLAVYLLGLVVSIHSWTKNPARQCQDLVFYLSVLGLGLFYYYQGRSHVLNLVSVGWPAMLIAGILADQHLRAIRAGLLGRWHLFQPAVAVGLLLVACYSFISHAPFLFASAEKKFATRTRPMHRWCKTNLHLSGDILKVGMPA
jgi:hypothetical protein